jgi:peroxiredoxin Q/BCP
MSLFVTDEIASVTVGSKAPDFVLRNEKGEDWRLSQKRGQVIAMLFYPANETLVCTKQFCSVRDHWKEYMETKAEVIGISQGTIESHKNFSEYYNLPLPLLADTEGDVTRAYSKHWWMPSWITRSVVIVDAEGTIRHRKVMLRAFRPTDKSVIAAIHLARYDKIATDFKNKM